MSGKPFGYAGVSVTSDADSSNLEKQRRVLADCEQVRGRGQRGLLEPARG